MSDLGSDVANTSLKLTKEMVETINKLLLLAIKNSEKNAKLRTNSKAGLMRLKNLKESNSKIIPLKTEISSENLRKFDRYAKAYGVAYATLGVPKYKAEIKEIKKKLEIEEDEVVRDELAQRLKDLENRKENKIIFIKAEDINLIADITSRLNEEIDLSDINEEIKLYEENGIDQFPRLDELRAKKEKQTDMRVIEDGDFEHAINDVNAKIISRGYKDTDKSMVICDMLNPENYISVNATEEKREVDGEICPYTATYYEVYHNDLKVKCDEFSHGQFRRDTTVSGLHTSEYGKNHWENIKREMHTKSQIGNHIIIFANINDYKKYKKRINEKKNDMKYENTSEYREINYVQRLEKLENEVKTATKEQVENITNQIEICHQINAMQTQLALITNGIDEEGKNEQREKEIKENIQLLEKRFVEIEKERALIESKQIIDQINTEKDNIGVEIENSTHGEEKDNVNNMEKENDTPTQSMDKWSADVKENDKTVNINNSRNNIEFEKGTERE